MQSVKPTTFRYTSYTGKLSHDADVSQTQQPVFLQPVPPTVCVELLHANHFVPLAGSGSEHEVDGLLPVGL